MPHATDKVSGRLIGDHRAEDVAIGRVTAVVDGKRRVTRRQMHPVVVGKLGIAEPVNPITLVRVDVEAQALLRLLVHPFHLAIGLWVVGSGGVILDTHQPVEVDGKLGLELRSPVMDDLGGNPMKAKNIVPEQLGAPFRLEVVGMACICFEKQSSTTRMVSCPCEGGRGPTRSIEMVCQGLGGTSCGWREAA